MSVVVLPELVTDRLFGYLTDEDVGRVIAANGKRQPQIFDNMAVSQNHYERLPKCWGCWRRTETVVYSVGGKPQYRDGRFVGYSGE